MDNTEKLSIYKTKINTTKIGVGHHSTQTSTHNVNKT
jgi:hypothetical protein